MGPQAGLCQGLECALSDQGLTELVSPARSLMSPERQVLPGLCVLISLVLSLRVPASASYSASRNASRVTSDPLQLCLYFSLSVLMALYAT